MLLDNTRILVTIFREGRLKGVTYNNTQNKLVAIGYWGAVATSTTNGVWNQQPDLEGMLESITCSEDLYVAVGSHLGEGAIFISSNGESWSSVTISSSETLNQVIWSGSQFTAVGGEGAIFTSTNGTTWLKRTSGTSNSLYGIAWNGSFFAAVGNSGTALKSTDGITWTDSSPSFGYHLGDIIWAGSHFVGLTIYDGYVFATTDGTDVTPFNTNSSAGMFYSIAYNGTRFVILGSEQTILTAP